MHIYNSPNIQFVIDFFLFNNFHPSIQYLVNCIRFTEFAQELFSLIYTLNDILLYRSFIVIDITVYCEHFTRELSPNLPFALNDPWICFCVPCIVY